MMGNVCDIDWLFKICVYCLCVVDQFLFEWYYLVCGDCEVVYCVGELVCGWIINEDEVGDFEYYIVDCEL